MINNSIFAASLRTPAICALLSGLAPTLAAQEKPTLESLQERLDRVTEDFEAEREFLGDEVDVLRRELAGLRSSSQPAKSASIFNPSITLFGNMLARVDDRRVFAEDDPAEGRLDDRFHFRELEIDFRAAVDPFADAVVITSFESEVPGEYEAGIEEAYIDLKRIPILESAPAGLKLRVGRFRPEFGRFNQIHLHDLPQPHYPRSLGTFLGEEGYVQEGVSARFFLPAGGDENSLEANVQLLSGGGLPVAENEEGSNLAGLARVKFFRELSSASTMEVGSSLWHSDTDHQLYGLDATYKWKPLSQGESRSFLLGGELFRARLDETGLDRSPMGFYVWSQYQLAKNLYAGARYDHAETLADDRVDTRTSGVYLSYYTSEFLRFRLGYEHLTSDDPILDGRDSILLELNFIFGSHPTEPYWVSR